MTFFEFRKPRERADGRDSGARRLAIRGPLSSHFDTALITQLRHPAESVSANGIQVGIFLECLFEMRKCALVARFAQRISSLGLDEIAGVAFFQHASKRGRCFRVTTKFS